MNLLRALLMLIAANSVPWLLGRLFPKWGAVPMDLGLTLADGRRLLGSHKTWRGFFGGGVASAAVGISLGLEWWPSIGVGALSLLGDAASSALKRRLGRAPGSDVPVVDQVPEALLPLLLLHQSLELDAAGIVLVVFAFAIIDMGTTRMLSGQKP